MSLYLSVFDYRWADAKSLCAGSSVSANWAALKAQIAPSGSKMRPRKAAEPQDTAKAPEAIAGTQGVTPVLAVDCEMVGAGPEGARSLLAR